MRQPLLLSSDSDAAAPQQTHEINAVRRRPVAGRYGPADHKKIHGHWLNCRGFPWEARQRYSTTARSGIITEFYDGYENGDVISLSVCRRVAASESGRPVGCELCSVSSFS